MDVDVSAVPTREPGMEPFEVMTSESQERMLAIVEPADLDEVLAICARWEVRATVVGTRDRRAAGSGCSIARIDGAEVLADVPAASLHDDAPLYDRPLEAPVDLDDRRADGPSATAVADAADAAERPAGHAGRHQLGVVAVRPPAVPQHRRRSGRRRHRAAAQAPGDRRRHRPRPGPDHRRQPPVVRGRPTGGHRGPRGRGGAQPGLRRRPAPRRWSTASTSATRSTPR